MNSDLLSVHFRKHSKAPVTGARLLLNQLTESTYFKMKDELTSEVSYLAWSFFMLRSTDFLHGALTPQERVDWLSMICGTFISKTDKNFELLYSKFRTEKYDKENGGLMKQYMKKGVERYANKVGKDGKTKAHIVVDTMIQMKSNSLKENIQFFMPEKEVTVTYDKEKQIPLIQFFFGYSVYN